MTGQHSGTDSGGVGAGEPVPTPACVVAYPEQSWRAHPAVQMRESRWADQLSFHPAQIQSSELAHPPPIYIISELLDCVKGTSPDDPKLQDLHDPGRQQEHREESQWGSGIDGVTEPKISNQTRFVTMNICK